MLRKVALYDFDDTLLPYDSMGRLVLYTLKHRPWLIYRALWIIPYALLYALKLIPFRPLKQQILFPLKYLSEADLKDFYLTLTRHYYPEVVATLKKHHADGYYCMLVSASPESYLKYTDLPFDVVIGTRMAENSNVMVSANCKAEEKVARIQEILKEQDIQIDYDASYGYSDSRTDLPMLLLVKQRIRVVKHTGQMVPFIEN